MDNWSQFGSQDTLKPLGFEELSITGPDDSEGIYVEPHPPAALVYLSSWRKRSSGAASLPGVVKMKQEGL